MYLQKATQISASLYERRSQRIALNFANCPCVNVCFCFTAFSQLFERVINLKFLNAGQKRKAYAEQAIDPHTKYGKTRLNVDKL